MEFKEGDEVSFHKSNVFSGDSVRRFFCETEGIPKKLIIHGSTQFVGNGTVIAIHNEFVIVKFKNPNKNKFTQLGFKPEHLVHVQENSYRISYEKDGKTHKEEVFASNKEAALAKLKYDGINYVMEG